MFEGKRIVLGVTGSIAAYKAASVCSALTQKGADVHVVMTESAKQFVTPLLFQTLSRNPVMDDTFKEPNPSKIAHIHYADMADVILVAPATAHTINKVRYGLGDNMITNMLLAVPDRDKVIIAPAMNVNMLHNPATEESLAILKERNMHVIPPDSGHLACGYDAEGKFPDTSTILAYCEDVLKLRTFVEGREAIHRNRL